MDTQRWRQIEEIYHSALDRQPGERRTFLDEACRGDSELRREVESLLAHEESGSAVLEPVRHEADKLVRTLGGAPHLAAGTLLGPYRIETSLGAGGMGEVYKALDTRLDRRVAVKILLSPAAGRTDLRQRFEREARAVSSLNHPHICTLHDVGHQDGIDYLVMEYLEGETIEQCLEKGPFALDQVLVYAIQISDALAQAHGQGVSHRDLKPGNIMLTKSGAKLLDFGLAKLRSPGPLSETSSLATATALTEEGMILGTLHYMAPEQVKGKPADRRSDIFAFGAVLYEMVTGARAFHGDSKITTLAAILEKEPAPMHESAKGVPPELEKIIARCLRKDPARRVQDAGDLKLALEELKEEFDAGRLGEKPAVAPVRSRKALWVWTAIAAAVALAGGVMLDRRLSQRPLPTLRQLTYGRGMVASARFAPDGKTILYSAAWDGKPLELFSTRPESPESRPLGLPSANVLSISTSGELAITLKPQFYFTPFFGTLARLPLAGGAPRELANGITEADWSRDGSQLAVVRAGVWQLEYPIGKVLFTAGPTGWISHPRVSPKGDRVAFLDHSVLRIDTTGYIAVVDLAGKKTTFPKHWPTVSGLAWSPSGDELWFGATDENRQSSLSAVSMSGRERTIANFPGFITLHDVAPDGRVLLGIDNQQSAVRGLLPDQPEERNLSWLDGSYARDISADGRTLIMNEEAGAEAVTGAIYLRKHDGAAPVRLGDGHAIALSPDGKWVLGHLRHTHPAQIILLPTGAGQARTVAGGKITFQESGGWLPDSRQFLLLGRETNHQARTYLLDLDGGNPRPITPEGTTGKLVTPDGKYLLCRMGRKMGLYPIAGGDPLPVADIEGPGTLIRFSSDGRFVFTHQGGVPGNIYRVELATGRKEMWKQLMPADPAGVMTVWGNGTMISADGKYYAYSYLRVLSQLYQVDGLR